MILVIKRRMINMTIKMASNKKSVTATIEIKDSDGIEKTKMEIMMVEIVNDMMIIVVVKIKKKKNTEIQ